MKYDFKKMAKECGINLNKKFNELNDAEIKSLNVQRFRAGYLTTCNHIFVVQTFWSRLRQFR